MKRVPGRVASVLLGASLVAMPAGPALAAGSIATYMSIPNSEASGGGAANDRKIVDITETPKGQELAAVGAVRSAARGVPASASELRVWQLAPGEYLVGKSLPDNLRTVVVVGADGRTSLNISYDVGRPVNDATATQASPLATTASPSWVWLNQACFSRLSNSFGWLDSCYVQHGLAGETDPRDFYQLEQYGTVGAALFGKIYSGFLEGQQGSGSAPMSWIDWSPRGSLSGSCVIVPLQVSALGVTIGASGLMCEQWNIYKYTAAGHFKEEWSCGCIYPFGQPYPNTREIDYMQAISVPNGGLPRWTLSAGFLAQ